MPLYEGFVKLVPVEQPSSCVGCGCGCLILIICLPFIAYFYISFWSNELGKMFHSPPGIKNPERTTDKHAAIAYSPTTGRYGYAHDFATPESAKQRALSECNVADCEIKGYVKNGCGVLAKDRNGNVNIASAGSEVEAKRLALIECRRRGGKEGGCWILCSTCAHY